MTRVAETVTERLCMDAVVAERQGYRLALAGRFGAASATFFEVSSICGPCASACILSRNSELRDQLLEEADKLA